MNITKEKLKKLLINNKTTTCLDIYWAMFKTKEELVDDVLNHDNDYISRGLRLVGWDFQVVEE